VKAVQVPAKLTAFGASPADVMATVAYRDPGERAVRAVGGLGLFWGSRLACGLHPSCSLHPGAIIAVCRSDRRDPARA
jgi:hypothetical protein